MSRPAMAPLRVAFNCDANYITHTGVAMYSLLASNPGEAFHLHLLCTPLPAVEADRFASMAYAFGATLDIHPVDPGSLADLPVRGHITHATYFRLLTLELSADRGGHLLLLDSDLVVDGPVSPLRNADLSEAVLAACRDLGGQFDRHAAMQLDPDHYYFNAGVMLVNLDAWRRGEFFRHTVDYLRRHGNEAVYLDQDALNHCLQRRTVYLEGIWNYMPYLNFTRVQPEYQPVTSGSLKPLVVHYAGPRKPWQLPPSTDRFTSLYWEYRRQSPWAGAPA